MKWHKAEVALLWLIIAIGAVLIITGAGVYFYVSRLAIVEQTSLVSNKYFVIAQVKMPCDFTRALGVVFSLVGVVAIIFAVDGFAFATDVYMKLLY